ncbi:hypothetical protein [Alterisphingorhabdus coralli]|uniref:Uncharacterized protein n=1 Tax=Alterisphingorhabdus coralli TaxID=3071408 RepID=A0AA97I052_9SPHN|nr:hypothetical protein [Parasphingorhabdus sp. SCSIO 66989]WOE75424.1 hypothetical protein RB602_01535 [Parasphingorhabdus sp. SCSIO 66989]
MATKKKGQLTVSPEWAKHLRAFAKRQFWRGERRAGQNEIRKEVIAARHNVDKAASDKEG